eukprot:scaffold45032_cov18-Tisochrysis_lutea.AAC.2
MEEREADLAKARGTRSEVERDLNEITLKMRKLQGKARALEPPWNVTLKHTLHAKDACKYDETPTPTRAMRAFAFWHSASSFPRSRSGDKVEVRERKHGCINPAPKCSWVGLVLIASFQESDCT